MLLENLKHNLSITDAKEFLRDNEEAAYSISNSSECGKWNKWLLNNEIPYPCVCSTRNDGCIFMQVYHELFINIEISNYVANCLEALLDYHSIKHNTTQVRAWFRTNYKLKNLVSAYNNNIRVHTTRNPTEYLKIEVECPNPIKDFQKLYNELLEEYWK
jgi:hypothetical protein